MQPRVPDRNGSLGGTDTSHNEDDDRFRYHVTDTGESHEHLDPACDRLDETDS